MEEAGGHVFVATIAAQRNMSGRTISNFCLSWFLIISARAPSGMSTREKHEDESLHMAYVGIDHRLSGLGSGYPLKPVRLVVRSGGVEQQCHHRAWLRASSTTCRSACGGDSPWRRRQCRLRVRSPRRPADGYTRLVADHVPQAIAPNVFK